MRVWKFYGYRRNSFSIGWWFIGWDVLSLGVNIGLPYNLEIHLPFGFILIGNSRYYQSAKDV